MRGMRDAIEGLLPRERFADQRDILGGAGQNVVGLVFGVAATFGIQVLMTRTLGAALFGVVTLASQIAFVGSAATRFGMDMASVRLVAILMGRGEAGRLRPLVARAGVITLIVSIGAGLALFAVAGPLSRTLSSRPDAARTAFQAAALALPFSALAQTYLGATRGLKIMRHTLYIFWIGQPLAWIVFALLGWVVAESAGITVLAYAGSWALATALAWWAWERESRGFAGRTDSGGIPQEGLRALLRFGGLRAPATLFSQLLFWTDLFVLAQFASSRVVGVYSAAIRTAQSLLLFLTSLSLVFSPFVADLHAKGEHERLDGLYKNVTRWSLAATLPVLLVLAILPDEVLRVFGGRFASGDQALLILIAGMIVPVSVGTVGFILIMVGRTGWDLLVYASAFALDVAVAWFLARPSRLGMEGAALAQALTLTFSSTARLFLVHRFVGIWPFERHFARLLPAAVAGAGVMLLVHLALPDAKWLLNLGASAITGSLVYGVVLVLIGLKPGERAMIFRLAGRVAGRASA